MTKNNLFLLNGKYQDIERNIAGIKKGQAFLYLANTNDTVKVGRTYHVNKRFFELNNSFILVCGKPIENIALIGPLSDFNKLNYLEKKLVNLFLNDIGFILFKGNEWFKGDWQAALKIPYYLGLSEKDLIKIETPAKPKYSGYEGYLRYIMGNNYDAYKQQQETKWKQLFAHQVY